LADTGLGEKPLCGLLGCGMSARRLPPTADNLDLVTGDSHRWDPAQRVCRSLFSFSGVLAARIVADKPAARDTVSLLVLSREDGRQAR
jgi:hypothetical protein